jgi:hypothetical protein
MTDEIRVMLGDASANFTDAQIGLALKHALAEVEAYCKRKVDYELRVCAERIAVLKLLRTNTEGLASQSFSGVSESYVDGYPADIQSILDRKRKITVLG